MKRNWRTFFLAASFILISAGCSNAQAANTGAAASAQVEPAAVTTADGQAIPRPEGWTEETHGNNTDPNYEVVFPNDSVNQLTITISPEDWQAMQANMTELLGAPGTRQGRGGQAGQMAPQAGQQPPADGPPAGGAGGPGGMGGNPDMTPENPMWIEATIEFNGQNWSNVGVRYKGNSTLQQAWSSSNPKMGLKLDFDQFEDEHPEIENQRFYGFKQLSLSSNWGDATYMRETVAYDLLEEAGLPAANTAFYEVTLDHGDGKTSLGIYTMVEVVDDTVVDRVFGEDSGNIYEADGSAASLAAGTEAQIEASFQKENNEDAADWSDIQALYNVLHSEERTADPAAWRAELEAVFDTDAFLEWLAISAAIGHWDTYGQMNHNYYLYNDPDTGQLTWISWDHNYILGSGGGGARGQAVAAPADGAGAQAGGAGAMPGGMGGRGNVSLDKTSVGANWPLIRYLLDDPTYYAAYVGYLEDTANGVLVADKLEAKYQNLATLLEPYASREGSGQSFQTAVQSLIQATRDRAKAVSDFLATQASES